MTEALNNLRDRLDEVDRRLVEILADRLAVVQEVASLKADHSARVRDLPRESEILERISGYAREAGLNDYFVTSLFQKIIDHSVRYQSDHIVDRDNPDRATDRTVVAYQGTDGAYSHMAARHHFSASVANIAYHGYDTFRLAVEAVEAGDAQYAVLPIENTTAGSINETYDLLAESDLAIIAEEILEVDHCLLGIDEVPLSLIRRISSHPQAIAQCSGFLSTLSDCHVESYIDTALAARRVYEDQDLSHAAIASEEAADRYGLRILKRHLSDRKQNFTRFVIVARQPVRYDERFSCKTSLVFATAHEKGALLRCMNTFAQHGLNLTKLESRPRPDAPWEYLFYVDFEGNMENPDVQRAIEELRSETRHFKILGSYPIRTEADPTEVVSVALRATRSSDMDRVPVDKRAAKPTAPAVHVHDEKPYRLVSRRHHREDTVIEVGPVAIGGPDPIMIAGPCSVESRSQIEACAKAVHETGGHILRGGCFKPRTSPYAFQGLGYEGLDMLTEAGRSFGLPIVTEVLEPGDVAAVARQVDVLQIGARNMQNFPLLKAVGRSDRPVLLKRGMMSSIDEWLSAAEYVLAHGNPQVILCERGIRTFETATRNTLDVSAIPIVRELTHLPVIVDPSHACGVRRWVTPLALAGLAAGANGIMVEIHPEPDTALSDGKQSLDFPEFVELAETLAGRLGRVPASA
ncbi:MAG: bifunctional 3-deoxy-7-phosphoheptulonate synthase/chorismate mutase [Rhodothermales bacterium]|nr:bifunctional 3-deoxy-7-phosphoheptulonate synthase/chorismate mutase [Rhodothermales bacterium]